MMNWETTARKVGELWARLAEIARVMCAIPLRDGNAAVDNCSQCLRKIKNRLRHSLSRNLAIFFFDFDANGLQSQVFRRA